ncbi:MAG: TrpB-like pyridoxal phosphate-dependent enzyme [Ignavibacteriaceae bacterium]|nr:TrpB-like pyridoxal phosphate-dependent enzyme [Ignavibacteriaceae bacterium]
MQRTRFYLDASRMPRSWYNIAPDLPGQLPAPLHPGTKQPVGPEDLMRIFPIELLKQEMATERFIEIPDEVRDLYYVSRPTPLIRAVKLEKYLDTPAKIYFKHEGLNPAGSHKTNTSIPQAYYNKIAGIKKLVTETGAGQWGSALSFACQHFGLECEVYMVKVSYNQKPYRRSFMQLFGAEVIASPSVRTMAGRRVLEENPDSPGSLGIAISEAVELAAQRDDTNYALGSVLNHVLLHQTIIGQEAKIQMEMAEADPDIIIACVGGGCNFSGMSFPFIQDKLSGKKKDLQVIAVEPASCPTLTKGTYAYDFGDEAGLTPLMKMHTLGHKFLPPSIHAGGLRYHGMAPMVSYLYEQGVISAEAYDQVKVFDAAALFAKTEGILPAPESSHAIRSVINHALACRESGESKTILFNLSGHGFFDLGAYDAYVSKGLKENILPDDELKTYLKSLPEVYSEAS